MAVAPPTTALGCGRDIDQVWAHISQAPDPHEQTCPFCRSARADLAPLADATTAMRDGEATSPDRDPGPDVLDRILAVARAEVRRGRRLPLDQPSATDRTSPNTVSEQAVCAVVRRVGDRTDDVQIRRCTVVSDTSRATVDEPSGVSSPDRLDAAGSPDRGPAVPVPGAVRVSLRMSVAFDRSIVEVSEQLRHKVMVAIEEEVGMVVRAVDITVEDIHGE